MLQLFTWRARLIFWGIFLLLAAFLFLPLLWMGVTSIKPENEVFVRLPTLFPKVPTWVNYTNLFSRSDMVDQLRNSLITAGGGALLTVVLATYAAYSFAKFRYRGRKPLMFLMLSAQMFPFTMMLISLYPLLQWAGLLGD